MYCGRRVGRSVDCCYVLLNKCPMIAIFQGMAAAYYAVKMIPNVSITVYDNESGPGLGGASSAPVTLLHPYTPKGKVIWRGYEGFQSVLDVMNDVNYDASDMRIYRPFFDSKRFHKYRCRVEPSAQVRQLL